MAVDDQSEVTFSISKGRCHGNQILLVLAHGCRWAQAANGAAGRANVGLYPASSLIWFDLSKQPC